MKLFQEWIAHHNEESDALAQQNKQLLIVGTICPLLLFLLFLPCFNGGFDALGMSATALESEQEEAFTYGMHFFCPKPVSLELLTIILAAKREFETNELAINKVRQNTPVFPRRDVFLDWFFVDFVDRFVR